MVRADELTVVLHDDTIHRFTGVRYMLSRRGLRVVLDSGEEIRFPQHDVLTTHVNNSARTVARAEYAIAA